MRTDTDRVTLDYRTRDRGGEWQTMNYPVRLSWIPCTYGAQRAWCLVPEYCRFLMAVYQGKLRESARFPKYQVQDFDAPRPEKWLKSHSSITGNY